MNATLAIVIKDVAKAKSKDTVRTLYLRITVQGKQIYLDTGHRCAIKNYYNKNNQFVRPGTAYADQINTDIRSKIAEIEGILARTTAKLGSVNLEAIKNLLAGRLENGIKATLYSILEEWKHTRKLSENSYELYKISIDSFLKFCAQSNYNSISAQALNAYTTSKYFNLQYFQIIRFLLVPLEKSGLISKYVLEQVYDIKPDKNKPNKEPVALTEAEIEHFYIAWRDEIKDEIDRMVIGSFVLLCETGMRYSDLTSLNDGDIRYLNGVHYIEKYAKKGNKKFAVPLTDRAQEIISFYRKPGTYFQFYLHQKRHSTRVASYHKVLNRYTKILKIDLHLTSHVGRHSFITIMSQKGVHMAHIQSMVGHSDYKMTERYKSLDKSAAFKDFFAATTNSKHLSNKYYQALLGKIRNKIIEQNVSDKELNRTLALHGIDDDVNEYLNQKKIMGAVACYALHTHLLANQLEMPNRV